MRYCLHETPEEKFERKCKYMELREAGQSRDRAARFRDWKLEIVRLICSGEAKPK